MRVIPTHNQILPVGLDRPLQRYIPRTLYSLSNIVKAVRNMPQTLRCCFESWIRCVLGVAVEQLLRIHRALQNAPEKFSNVTLVSQLDIRSQ